MNLVEKSSIVLGEPISSIDLSKEYLTVGTLDEEVHVYQQPFQSSQSSKFKGHLMGVIDVSINHEETQSIYLNYVVAVSSLDSTLRIWDIDDKRLVSEILCDPFVNWKVRFVDQFTVITAGEHGNIYYYHVDTKERLQKVETDPLYYATSLQVRHRLIALGNENGSVFLVDEGKKSNVKVASKAIRSLCFYHDNKLIAGSEDGQIRLIDLQKMQVESIFRGHKYGVNDLCQFGQQFVSCATDRTIRIWDINQKYSIKEIVPGNDKPGSISGVRVRNNQIIAAYDCGTISFYE